MVLSALLISASTFGQTSRLDKAAHVIDVVATGSANAEADTAIITVSVKNYGPTEKAAYEQNARLGNQLLEALEKAGVSKSAIETGAAEVNETQLDRDWTPEQKIAQRYQAKQSLVLTVKTKNAATVVNLAIHSNASSLDNVKWELRDASNADEKAMTVALANAKTIAAELAQGAGVKVGAIISLSNSYERREFDRLQQYSFMNEDVRWIVSSEPIALLPQRIKESADVHVVFAME